MVTFNVVFTPGSPARLLPFTLSLLQSPNVRIRVVSNGCHRSEVDVLGAVSDAEERISHYVLPFEYPMEHGLALNHLFAKFPDPQFAFVDSDVIASGDFMAELWPPASGQAAVFAAPPVWVTDDEAVVSPGASFLSGRWSVLRDGTPIGGTYCAVYDRGALEPALKEAPRGFAVHHGYMLRPGLNASLEARGWRFRIYDTGRLVNLLLLLRGATLENRQVGELHHVGGFSAREFEGPGAALRTLIGRLRSGTSLGEVSRASLMRLYSVGGRDRSRRRRATRRRAVVSHLDQVLEAILADESTPPRPSTDSAQVDRRLDSLVAAVEAHYPAGLATLRGAAWAR